MMITHQFLSTMKPVAFALHSVVLPSRHLCESFPILGFKAWHNPVSNHGRPFCSKPVAEVFTVPLIFAGTFGMPGTVEHLIYKAL